MLDGTGRPQKVVLVGDSPTRLLRLSAGLMNPRLTSCVIAAPRQRLAQFDTGKEPFSATVTTEVIAYDRGAPSMWQELIDTAFSDSDLDVAIADFGNVDAGLPTDWNSESVFTTGVEQFVAPATLSAEFIERMRAQGHGHFVGLMSIPPDPGAAAWPATVSRQSVSEAWDAMRQTCRKSPVNVSSIFFRPDVPSRHLAAKVAELVAARKSTVEYLPRSLRSRTVVQGWLPSRRA